MHLEIFFQMLKLSENIFYLIVSYKFDYTKIYNKL